ncbi:MAG: PhoX family protein [Epsilonproteobacteria bacterium]|nr:PhoX family protein [Campylobacterota bacterium]
MIRNIALSAITILAIGLTGCGSDENSRSVATNPQETLTGIDSIAFEEIATATAPTEKAKLLTTKKVTINGTEQSIDFTSIMATGDKDNNETFGLVKDMNDNVIKFEDGSPYICNGTNGGVGSGLDFSSILQKNGKLYMVNQFECQIGAMYMFELNQDATTGALSPKKDTLQFISQKEEFGGFVHCAGQATPWNSHLGSEEYETDARFVEEETNATTGLTGSKYYDETAKFFGGDITKLNPYYYGWTPEVRVKADGTPDYSKHYAMGRFSHELSYVMPDKKTVYMSDDGTNVGLFMFVADKAEDLSAGTLYVAKVTQNHGRDGGDFSLSWIDLGHADNAEVRAIVALKPNFSTFFESATVNADNSCPTGFSSINTTAGHECLKLKAGVDENIVSRVETRRYAALKGATTEFRKEEGITFNPATNKLYVAMSAIERGMEDNKKGGDANDKYDKGGNNDIKVEYNYCGAIYELDVANDTNIKSDYVATNMKGILTGNMIAEDANGNKCDLNGISNPDNVTMLPGTNLLTIGEDTSKHENNIIWTYDLDSGKLSRILSTPVGAETTSPFWYTNVNGFGYMTAVTQHPDTTSADKGESSVGVLGPIKFK